MEDDKEMVDDTGRNLGACCGNCPFWFRTDPDGGQCRVSPPRMFVLPTGTAGNIIKGAAGPIQQGILVQPVPLQTTPEFWCGEHPEFWCGEHPDILYRDAVI